MKKIKVIIERSKDSYWAYSDDLEGVTGVGDTVEAAKRSAEESVQIQKELGNIVEADYKLIYKFDTESLLNYYKNVFSAPAMKRMTGINEKQIHHYMSGLKKPRDAQKKKIETALHKLGAELMAIEL